MYYNIIFVIILGVIYMAISNKQNGTLFLLIFIFSSSLFFTFTYKSPVTASKNENVISLNNSKNMDKIMVIAHRSVYLNEPENSISAIKSSINHNIQYAEIDVQETKDGTVVLMHDRNLKRLTGLNRKVDELNYSEIENLHIKSHFASGFINEKIPTLDNVIKTSKGKINLIIEIKPYARTYQLAKNVVNIIEKDGMVNKCMVHSLSYRILLNVRKLNPNISTGYIATSRRKDLAHMDVNFFSIKQNLLTPSLIANIHKSHRKIYAWTVDSTYSMRSVISLHVDGIITDYPQTLINIIRKNSKPVHKI